MFLILNCILPAVVDGPDYSTALRGFSEGCHDITALMITVILKNGILIIVLVIHL